MTTKIGSSSSSSTPKWKYDVFLSFRGEDTRNSFTDHLYTALKQKGIFAFRDEEKLDRGKSISLELFKAIEESRFAIVILSKNYASSTWCLDELGKIIECMKEMEMIVLPIFYDVDPSNVRKQTGTFAQAFAIYEKCFNDNIKKVQTWRTALREVANLKGWHLQDRPESKLIQNIVGKLWHKLNNTLPEDIKDLIGMESRVKELESCLALDFNDVRIIGIWGMGGMGKTTLARVVFNKVSRKFENSCFLANVREVCEKDGLIPLQQQLIDQILDESMSIRDVNYGVSVIRNRFRHKRILLVLDDVNQLDQLEKLVGKHDWFGMGSRVIITTRDKHLLKLLEANEIYGVEGLNDVDALYLLSLKAFKKDHPPEDYLELSKDFVHYVDGLPLALEILGSFLFGRSINQWKSTLNRLKEFPEDKIFQVLKISFDGLHKTEKEIFLDIACFFNHESEYDVVQILDSLGLYPDVGLGVLVDKSLIKTRDGKLWMHDLLQGMGKNIVYQECPNEPGKRSRLWSLENIDNVLTQNTGTKEIQSIVLKFYFSREAHWNPESFSKMQHLKLLIFDNINLQHDLKHLPTSLRILDWKKYPSKSLPSSFQSKTFESLKSIQLIKSLKLIETPNFINMPVLEKLVLEDCINLRMVHRSIGAHKKLTLLNLKGCKNLRSLPRKFEMQSLEILILSNCSKLKQIPEFGRNMECVYELYLDETAITILPTSINHLTSLTMLNLRDCKSLVSLPNTFCNMKSLKNLNLSGCSKLGKLIENIENVNSVEKLDVSGNAIRQHPSSNVLLKIHKKISFDGYKGLSSTSRNKLLPSYSMPRSPHPVDSLFSSLCGLCSLTNLDLSDCNLKAISNDIGGLFSLRKLCLSGNNFVCLPESIIQLSNLEYMFIKNCKSLRSLPKLPLSIDYIDGSGCTSLDKLPDLLKPNSLFEPFLYLSNCNKLASNQGSADIFFAMIKKSLQEFSLQYPFHRYQIVIPGSEIPKWFSHQSVGNEVNIKEPSYLCNEWIGIAACVMFCTDMHYIINEKGGLSFYLLARGFQMYPAPCFWEIPNVLSDHLWLLYVFPQCYAARSINGLWTDVNGFSEIGIRIESNVSGLEVKKVGFQMVYKKDIEDFNRTMAQCSNNITPYEGLDVPHHNFDNSTVAVQGNKVKQNNDEYDGAGPSGEGSSNNVLNPDWIETQTKFMFHANSNWEESSEYKDYIEEYIESDLER